MELFNTFMSCYKGKITVPVVCPNCFSKEVTLTHKDSILMICYPFQDVNGKTHTHDINNLRQHALCNQCRTNFSYAIYNHCWCGWSSGKVAGTM